MGHGSCGVIRAKEPSSWSAIGCHLQAARDHSLPVEENSFVRSEPTSRTKADRRTHLFPADRASYSCAPRGPTLHGFERPKIEGNRKTLIVTNKDRCACETL